MSPIGWECGTAAAKIVAKRESMRGTQPFEAISGKSFPATLRRNRCRRR
jgi:hypothetical protein